MKQKDSKWYCAGTKGRPPLPLLARGRQPTQVLPFRCRVSDLVPCHCDGCLGLMILWSRTGVLVMRTEGGLAPDGGHFPPPESCETLVGRSPPFVLGGIQLSGLPWSLVQARRRPCSALLCTGQPFHPVSADLGIAPSSPLTGRVSFLFRCQPSPATPLGVVHPAVREELPQEITVAHPPTRVLIATIHR